MLPIHDSKSTNIFPFWIIVIIALNAFVFFLELSAPNLELFINKYALIPALVDFSRFETLFSFITSQFLHGGWLHILSNMWFLWVFGDNVEERYGFLLFPIIYILSGIVAGLSQYIFMGDSTIPMLGASGAVAGVLGSYFVFFPNHSIRTLVPVFGFFTLANIPAFVMLIYWFITQLFVGAFSITDTQTGGVAYFAHVGGFIAGWLIAKLFPKGNLLEQI